MYNAGTQCRPVQIDLGINGKGLLAHVAVVHLLRSSASQEQDTTVVDMCCQVAMRIVTDVGQGGLV